MMKSKLIIALLVLITSIGKAQTTGKISGTIKNASGDKIINATISLLKAKDSSLVKLSLTDKEGNFTIENIHAGNYLISATSVGYTKMYSAILNYNGKDISTGTLQMVAETKTLKAVTVDVKKPFIERRIDKTIINVDALISNAGSTAMEVLEKSPGISVDKDGNISLKGKQGVKIMLDGKPSYISGADLVNFLRNLPASNVDQIEIMTNPSAKYDASGNSGIINIKTKRISK